MPVALVVIAAVSVAASAAMTVEQKKAADAAAGNAKTVAGYNAALDKEEANQIDLDTTANVAAMRKDAAAYMSRQTAAYVGAGVMADSGSALAVRAATAGKMEMREQQAWNDSQAKEQHLAAEGAVGVAEGDYQANQDHMEGVAAVMGGAAKVASKLGSAYAGGAFGSAGSSTSTALTNGAAANAGPGDSMALTDPGE